MIPIAYLAAGALALGFGGGWYFNGLRLGAQISAIEAKAARQDTEHRAKEREWGKITLKITEDAYAEAETLRAALARADAAGRSLHDAGQRRAAEASAAAGPGSPAGSAALVLADVLGRVDQRAGELAAALDAAHAAGVICERFDALTR